MSKTSYYQKLKICTDYDDGCYSFVEFTSSISGLSAEIKSEILVEQNGKPAREENCWGGFEIDMDDVKKLRDFLIYVTKDHE